MRIHRVEIAGFGPFRDRQVVDLDAYAADGIFLISGRTGAGKSSILDAVCFALYGSAPRYEEGEKRLRSDHVGPGDPTEVVLEFSSGGRTWRVVRKPEYLRPKKRGEGMTTSPARAQMLERVDGEWIGRAARPVDVAHLIDDVVGLTQQQFLQVILLAQGRFARFLLAKNDERLALLRTLFGTRRFEEYERELEERRREVAAELAGESHALFAQLDHAEQLADELEQAAAVEDAADGEGADGEGAAREGAAGEDPARAGAAGGGARSDETGGEDSGSTGEADAPGSAAAGEGAGWTGGADDAEDGARTGGTAADANDDRSDRRVADARAAAAGDDRSGGAVAGASGGESGARGGGAEPGERLARVERAALRARHFAEAAAAAEHEAAKARDAAEAAHNERLAQRDKQQRRDAARARLDELDACGDEIARKRRELQQARDAEALREPIAAAQRALTELQRATAAAEQSRETWREVSDIHGHEAGELPSTDAAAAELDAFAEAARTRIGAWQTARDLEENLPAAERAIEELRAEPARLDARADELAARAREVPERRETLARRVKEAQALAAAAEPNRDRVSQLEKRLHAARSAEGLRKDYALAAQRASEAAKEREHAQAEVDALHARRLAEIAGELAAELTEGEPCAVCGSTDHPDPAARGDDPVTGEALDSAERRRAAALADETRRLEQRREAELALRDAEVRSDGASAEELAPAVEDARVALSQAEAASAEREALETEQRALDDELAALERERSEIRERRAEVVARIETAADALARDRATIADARGASESVTARIEVERRLADAADALGEAQRVVLRAEATATDSASRLEAALTDSEFADSAEAAAALRDAAVAEELDARVREHDAAVTAAKATLMELELEMLPDELLDTEHTERALRSARSAWERAVARRAAADRLAGALREAVERAEAAHAGRSELAQRAAVVERLAGTVAGRAPNTKRMKLETFVLAAELEEIVEAANVRLGEMSGQRYSLQHTDALAARGAASGLGLEVLDRFTGRPRPPHSLSGGETFLASLALALGLAEVVTARAGGIRLDTLFIDEGFGSLDTETLDVAMRTLDELRQGGRTIGVISHVETMKDQIPAHLHVETTDQGWSTVRQETGLLHPAG